MQKVPKISLMLLRAEMIPVRKNIYFFVSCINKSKRKFREVKDEGMCVSEFIHSP